MFSKFKISMATVMFLLSSSAYALEFKAGDQINVTDNPLGNQFATGTYTYLGYIARFTHNDDSNIYVIHNSVSNKCQFINNTTGYSINKDCTSLEDGLSNYITYDYIPADKAPTATDVTFTGNLSVGQTLTGSYTYADEDSDVEDGTSFKWYASDDVSGTNKTQIGNGGTITLTINEENKYISFEVTPVNAKASGDAVESAINTTAVVALPSITSTAITTATEDTPYSYTITTGSFTNTPAITVTGQDGSSVAGLATVTDNGDGTALLQTTPTQDLINYLTNLNGSPIALLKVTATNATDSETAVQNFTLTVTEINDLPVITTPSQTTFTIAEGDTEITDVVGTDEENTSESLAWNINGTDSASFSISNGKLVLNSAADYETKSSYSIDLNVSDFNKTVGKALTINVTDTYDAPSAIVSSNTALDKTSLPNGNVVGSLTTTGNHNGNFSYSVISVDGDTSSTLFGISGSDLTFDNALSTSSAGSYQVVVQVTDSSQDPATTHNETITVTVGPNSAPNTPTLSNTKVARVSGDSVIIGKLTSTDSDTKDTVTLTITAGNNDGYFSIDSNNNLVVASPAVNLTNNSYPITVQASDGTNTPSTNFTLDVVDPLIFNYQGFLAKAGSGVNATLNITFRLYDSLTAAEADAIWSSERSVTVTNGLYNVDLGSKQMLNNISNMLSTNYYLGITIESNSEMTPRQLMAPSGYIKLLQDIKADNVN